jgi:hypothetical protein
MVARQLLWIPAFAGMTAGMKKKAPSLNIGRVARNPPSMSLDPLLPLPAQPDKPRDN